MGNLDPKAFKELAHEDPEMLQALKAANRRKLWLSGNLRHLTRPHGQRSLYDGAHLHMRRYPQKLIPLVWLCHRRMGKSFLLLLMCFERAISQPGADIKYACATRNQVKDIAEPMIGYILSTAPGRIQVRRDQHRLYLRLPEWPAYLESRIAFVGLDYKQGDLLRGQACDLACLDETRDISVLEYVITQVLASQFVGRNFPLLLLASTPPASMEHPFIQVYYEEAVRRGTAFVIPGSKNPDFTPEDKDMVVEELGGEESLPYRREIECELVPDTTRQVIPEWQHVERHVAVTTVIERPEYYTPYISLDCGWKDHAGCLFGYVDFLRQKLVLIGEIFENYLTVGQLAALIREKCEELFDANNFRRARFVADGNLLEINTLRVDHRLPFLPAEKWKKKKDQALAAYRTSLCEGKIEIEALNLPHYVRQHREGIWNKKKTDFERSETMGHLDLIAAAVYMHNQVRWKDNPIPIENLRDGQWAGPRARAGRKATASTKGVLGKMLGSRFRPW
jgi:hypothetical protein